MFIFTRDLATAMSQRKWLQTPVKGFLLDISGVLKDGNKVIEGSPEAVKRLQQKGIPFRLVTNETHKPNARILADLKEMGYELTSDQIFAPVPAVINILKKEKLRPHLLVHSGVMKEFDGVDMTNPNCVVIGDAAESFNYNSLNKCFSILIGLKNPILFSLGIGKYYMEVGGITMDLGPFVKAIEYATDVKPKIVGKPDPDYFHQAVTDMKLTADEVIMIGDDVQYDVGGAQGCGIRGGLVRTGKYRQSDECHPTVKPYAVYNNLKEAVDVLLN